MRQKDMVSSGKIDELLIDAFRDEIEFGVDEDNQRGEHGVSGMQKITACTGEAAVINF